MTQHECSTARTTPRCRTVLLAVGLLLELPIAHPYTPAPRRSANLTGRHGKRVNGFGVPGKNAGRADKSAYRTQAIVRHHESEASKTGGNYGYCYKRNPNRSGLFRFERTPQANLDVWRLRPILALHGTGSAGFL